MYVPLAQSDNRNVAIAARTAGDGLALVATMRDIIRRLDADIPLYQEGRLDLTLGRTGAAEKVFGGLFTFFGVSALVLAIVGLVGMVTFSVSRRTRELGVRITLGAHATSILWLVLRGGLIQLALGLTIGLAVAAAVAPSSARRYSISARTILRCTRASACCSCLPGSLRPSSRHAGRFA